MIKLNFIARGMTIFGVSLLASFDADARLFIPSRTSVIKPTHLSSFTNGGRSAPYRFPSNPRKISGCLTFDGPSDGGRQTDPQIAVGGGFVFVATNNGNVIYDKKGNFIDGVARKDFGAGIDPKIFYSQSNKVFGFGRWEYWNKADKSPVIIGISEGNDPTECWNLYHIPAPLEVDGGGIGISREWVAYSYPSKNKEKLFVMEMSDVKRGLPATVYHFEHSVGQPAITQGTGKELYFLSVTDTHFIISRIKNAGNGTPVLEAISKKLHKLKYKKMPPKSAQKGTDKKTASGDRKPKTLIYQDKFLWFSHTVQCEGRAAVQWHQIRLDGSIFQTGLISDPNTNYIETTLGVNKRQDILVGFQEVNENSYISPRMAFRKRADPKGTLRKTISLGEGEGATDGGAWGDYSSCALDGDNLLDIWTIQSLANKKGKGSTVISKAPFSSLR